LEISGCDSRGATGSRGAIGSALPVDLGEGEGERNKGLEGGRGRPREETVLAPLGMRRPPGRTPPPHGRRGVVARLVEVGQKDDVGNKERGS
jgi:hypothetical protein